MTALFSGPPTPPVAPAPTPMPDLQDPAVLAAQQQVISQAAARSGRASTVLSGAGGTYSNDKLGQA
jgi:hypothetical protein